MRQGMLWTNLSRREISRHLREMGTPASRHVVRKLLNLNPAVDLSKNFEKCNFDKELRAIADIAEQFLLGDPMRQINSFQISDLRQFQIANCRF